MENLPAGTQTTPCGLICRREDKCIIGKEKICPIKQDANLEMISTIVEMFNRLYNENFFKQEFCSLQKLLDE
jgi:hypothetical protein